MHKTYVVISSCRGTDLAAHGRRARLELGLHDDRRVDNTNFRAIRPFACFYWHMHACMHACIDVCTRGVCLHVCVCVVHAACTRLLCATKFWRGWVGVTCATDPCHSRCRSREWAPGARTSRRKHLASTSESSRHRSTNSRRGKGTGRQHRGALTKAVGEHQLLKTANICKLHTHRTLMVSAAGNCPCTRSLLTIAILGEEPLRI